VDGVPGLSDISTDPEVIVANLVLAALLLGLMFIDSAIFNATLEENSDEIGKLFAKFGGPIEGVSIAAAQQVPSLAKAGLMVGMTALIYGFLEPGFGFNRESYVLVLSLAIAFVVLTYVFDGGQVLFAERVYGIPSAIRLFPLAILLSVFCVAFSRFANLHPGVILGFIAAAITLGDRDLDTRTEARIIFFPMLAMIAVCLAAWLLLDPLRAANEDGSSLVLSSLEAAAVAVFIGGIQGILFTMLPVEFLDGLKIWRWSKPAWLLTTLGLTFVFFHIILNQEGTLASATDAGSIRALYILGAAFWLLTGATWLYFRLRRR
jgi:hypothetical protein